MFNNKSFDVDWCRDQFPALAGTSKDRPAVYLDGPGGSQVPQRVIDAIATYLRDANANTGGAFATSIETDRLLAESHRAMAAVLGADDPDCVAFGANMTTLTLSLSRALARTWKSGDNILLTRLEHDGNFTPWELAARDAGIEVRYVDIHLEDCTLDLDDLRRQLSNRTRLVAVCAASNAVGTLTPLAQIAALAHGVGAQVFVDAVHYAPHAAIDVKAWDCDYLVCSAYKFYGPHVGVLWGKRALLEALPVYKLKACPEALPHRWMTGTQSHEGIIGAMAAADYLTELGRRVSPAAPDRRAALVAAYTAIGQYERGLVEHVLEEFKQFKEVKIWGITDPSRLSERVPTFGFTHLSRKPADIGKHLAARGIYCWYGNFYALPLTQRLGLYPSGMVRVGLLHYNTHEEIDRLIAALADLPVA